MEYRVKFRIKGTKEIYMKHLITTIVGIAFLFGVCYADEKLELKDQKDKESYSLGYQFGQNLKNQGVDLNPEVYTSGLKDALGGKEPQIKPDEIRSIVTNLQQRLMAEQQKKYKELAAKNLSQSKAFLEENKKKEGIKTLPSGLQYKVLVEGSGKIPKADDKVTVQYRGTLIDGTEFDSSHKRGQPATFQVKGVIKGWSEALQLMKEGSKWQLFIPPELGYGERGQPPLVLPNSALIFEVELLAIK
jgi:FKBP-type peptidyl-prolyl cis-trans isomerase FklB